ncbi:hypothetical protein AAEX28_13500 [Lentisphaerota bacterium WC36G]|nr:Tad domain-containing protein [Lentisphaerae bacterium WC36]
MKKDIKRLHKNFSTKKVHKNEDGVALIFALGFLSVLLMVGLAFATSALLERKLAINNRSTVQSKLLTDSAISHVMGSLQSSIAANYTPGTNFPTKYISSHTGFLTIPQSDTSAPSNIKNRPLMISIKLDPCDSDPMSTPSVSNPLSDTDDDGKYDAYIAKELTEGLQEDRDGLNLLVWKSGTNNVQGITNYLNWTYIKEEPLKGDVNAYNNAAIKGRYAYIIEDITGKLDINDVKENISDTTKKEFAIIDYDKIYDPTATPDFTNSAPAYLGTFKDGDASTADTDLLYTSFSQLAKRQSFDSDHAIVANNLFSTNLTKEPEIYFDSNANNYFHKFNATEATFEALRDSFISDQTKLTDNATVYDPNSKLSDNQTSPVIGYFTPNASDLSASTSQLDRATFNSQLDRKNQIAANFFDFFDDDYIPTCNITNPQLSDNPLFFGNEKVPQISEVSIAIGGVATQQTTGHTPFLNIPIRTAYFDTTAFAAIELTDIYGTENDSAFTNVEYKIDLEIIFDYTIKAESSTGIYSDSKSKSNNSITISSQWVKLSDIKTGTDFNNDNDNNTYIIRYSGTNGTGFPILGTDVMDSPLFSETDELTSIGSLKAQLNVDKFAIKNIRLHARNGDFGTDTVVDFVKADKEWNTSDIKFDHNGEGISILDYVTASERDRALYVRRNGRHHLFTIQARDPRVNLNSDSWSKLPQATNGFIRSNNTSGGAAFIHRNSNVNITDIAETHSYNIGRHNQVSSDLQNNYKADGINTDYKTNINKDFESVNDFGELRHYFPNKLENYNDLAVIGNISRAKAFQTLNVAKCNPYGVIGNYEDGDANILSQLKFNDLIGCTTSKYNHKGFNPTAMQVLLINIQNAAMTNFDEIFKNFKGDDIDIVINYNDTDPSSIIKQIVDQRFPTEYDKFDTDNTRCKNLYDSGTNEAKRGYDAYGTKDLDIITAGLKKAINAQGPSYIGQQHIELFTSSLFSKSSTRYFYYKINIVAQKITDLEVGTNSNTGAVWITKDLGQTVTDLKDGSTDVVKQVSGTNTVYEVRSRLGAYDPYADTIDSTQKVQAIIRWDSFDKKFEVINYQVLN